MTRPRCTTAPRAPRAPARSGAERGRSARAGRREASALLRAGDGDCACRRLIRSMQNDRNLSVSRVWLVSTLRRRGSPPCRRASVTHLTRLQRAHEVVRRDPEPAVEVEPVRVHALRPDGRIEVELTASGPIRLVDQPVEQAAGVTTAARVGPGREVVHVEVVTPRQVVTEAEPGDRRRALLPRVERADEPVAARSQELVDSAHEVGFLADVRAQLAHRLEGEPGVGRKDLADLAHATARSMAVVAAATTTTSSNGARSASATAAAASPATRASITSARPLASVFVAISAASSAGASSSTIPPARSGSGRPPSSTGPTDFSATVTTPHVATIATTALTGAAPAGRPRWRPRSGCRAA